MNLDTAVLVLLSALITGMLIILLLLLRRRSPQEELSSRKEHEYSTRLAVVEAENQRLKEERGRAEGELSRVEEQLAAVQNNCTILREQSASLMREKQLLENREEQRVKEIDRQLRELEQTRKSLEQERGRVIADEKQRLLRAEENRNRMWAMHEQESIARMREICRKPEYSFPCFDNTSLPEGFDRALKPDFMVEFLDQYIIFDAKLSKSESLQAYLQNQVKMTAKKIKNSSSVNHIYSAVFFVVPSADSFSVRNTTFYEEGYTFYILPVEAFEPVIAVFRKLRDYDLAGAYDPQEREQVINLIAAFDNHIRQQNAVNILNTLRGIKVMAEKRTLPQELAEAAEKRRKTIRLDSYRPTDLLRLMDNPRDQLAEIAELIQPAAPDIDREAVRQAVGEAEREPAGENLD